ncbi:lamin tail domain-containing protein [Streptomyces sp. NPDC046915]|uniref:lamin tail domain-containing protein n=1 Tax=Streptomyces sp. NPDC046915 TaxID=3155257 RepID=UPI0033C3A4FB
MSVSVSVTARRVAAAAAAAAALVGAVALPASAAGHDHDRGRAHRQHVVISAVQYDSPGRDHRSNRSLNKEWVDVTNNARQDVNLEGWTLSDEDGHTYTFHHYRLEGRSTVRIHTGEGRDRDTDLYQDRRQYVWNNDHDTATLRNDRGRFVDDYSWGRDHRDHRDRRGGDRHDARH